MEELIDLSPVTLPGGLVISVAAVVLPGFSVLSAGIGVALPLVDVVFFVCTTACPEAPVVGSVAAVLCCPWSVGIAGALVIFPWANVLCSTRFDRLC